MTELEKGQVTVAADPISDDDLKYDGKNSDYDISKNKEIREVISLEDDEYIDVKPSTWKGKIWDSFDKPKRERWYLFKLDVTLLFIACAMVFTKALDQSNLSNAFVSGMKEELSLYGNELNYAKLLYGVGYCIGQIPTNVLISRVKPHILLSSIEVLWGIVTFASASFQRENHMYAARFFVGLFESATYPSLMYLICSCYRKNELAKRSAVLHISTQLGPMFSGYLQSAAYTRLSGVHGMAGWRWLYIIDGIITVPLGILTYFFLPDFPRNQKANWVFNEDEVRLAKKRLPQEAKITKVKFTTHNIINWFSTWHIYFFVIFFTISGIGADATDGFSLWFKSYNTNDHTEFTVPQINNYPTGLNGVSIISDFVACYISDNLLGGLRYPFYVSSISCLVPI